jgi:hypothetical protein
LGGGAGRFDPEQQKTTWGIYYSLSDDLIHWTDRQLLMQSALPWAYTCGDRDPVAYPSVIDPQSTSRSFETSGRRPCTSTSRDLVRVQIAISK